MMDFLREHTILYYSLTFFISMVISSLAIPSILHVSRLRHLFDDLGHFRKTHDHGIPRLGGVAIFLGFTIVSLLLCMSGQKIAGNYLLTGCIILFAMGLKDDLAGVNSNTKFVIQLVVCIILVIPGDFRLSGCYGIFGINELPYWLSVAVSILFIMLLVNAFNLIDGIDGLAAVTGIVANGTLAVLFMYEGQDELAAFCLAMTGATIGFLRYNLPPARIFMGDTGSLLIGLISAVMAIRFLEVNNTLARPLPQISCAPSLVFAILIGPVFDTGRVFIIRVLNGASPFLPDRNHIHHRMLRLGLTHLQTTLLLSALNLSCVFLVLFFTGLGNSALILIIGISILFFNWMITFLLRSRKRSGFALRNLFV